MGEGGGRDEWGDELCELWRVNFRSQFRGGVITHIRICGGMRGNKKAYTHHFAGLWYTSMVSVRYMYVSILSGYLSCRPFARLTLQLLAEMRICLFGQGDCLNRAVRRERLRKTMKCQLSHIPLLIVLVSKNGFVFPHTSYNEAISRQMSMLDNSCSGGLL